MCYTSTDLLYMYMYCLIECVCVCVCHDSKACSMSDSGDDCLASVMHSRLAVSVHSNL